MEEISPGQYRFPENLNPPKAPVYPFGNFADEEVRFAELDVLLEGRATNEVLAEAQKALQGLKLKVTP